MEHEYTPERQEVQFCEELKDKIDCLMIKPEAVDLISEVEAWLETESDIKVALEYALSNRVVKTAYRHPVTGSIISLRAPMPGSRHDPTDDLLRYQVVVADFLHEQDDRIAVRETTVHPEEDLSLFPINKHNPAVLLKLEHSIVDLDTGNRIPTDTESAYYDLLRNHETLMDPQSEEWRVYMKNASTLSNRLRDARNFEFEESHPRYTAEYHKRIIGLLDELSPEDLLE